VTFEYMARIIEAEASVLDNRGKLGVAQCIVDNRYNENAFTTPADDYSVASLAVAEAAARDGVRRFDNAKILQFRSVTHYGKDGEPDWEKLYHGEHPIPADLAYLGKDVTDGNGHYYFGRWTRLRSFKLLVMAGHGRNMDGSWDPGAIGCECQEANLTRELTKLIKAAADVQGLPCDIAPDRNHYSFFKNGGVYDVTGYNYVLEVHFNASATTDPAGDGRKKGTMFYIDRSEKGHTVEDTILRKLIEIGSVQAWDGVVITQRQESYKNGLMVQNAIRRQGVSHAVLETCFITDMDDILWYQRNKKLIATKIIEGIIEGFGLAKDADGIPCYDYVGKGIATAEALESMNVRESPNIYGTLAGVVYTGQRVEVLNQYESGWLRIVWPGSVDGYAFTSNVGGKYYKMI